MAITALLIYLVGLAVAFGLRTWLQLRRTGSSGFHGISGEPGSLRWWAGISFVAALVLGLTALALAAVDVAARPSGSTVDAAGLVGLVLALVGFAGVLAAQTGMGSSWRIGVKETERTELVTGGLFALVRNPIFTAMVVAQLGLTLMVPTWLSVAALVYLAAAVEMQVRLIEEPYLLATHGGSYAGYAAVTGRFIPGVGRRDEATLRAG
ncbi:isoprenylcysteine carboxylmethyltransferase family protein [Geodermatophilus sp. DSM 45219]|uniref:methyltransferase family protein n=1 Tax=Geodermatophilus sp. DSM 45219 TaxID=1881103 RepID=UPI00088341B5|nr:isoprenylcysteine carboxylmethyltransferase family protein [Geodermatophilus sp. DSM 45219]SDO37101.1 Protein-S-isoprenylcysteine O-methyltransferase Ste14 [Geodermatophilus sp. DSM 45219]